MAYQRHRRPDRNYNAYCIADFMAVEPTFLLIYVV